MEIVAGTAAAPPPETLIREVEAQNGVTLPDAFVAFLRRANGARFDMTVFDDASGRERVIERALCLVDYHADAVNGQYDIRVVLSQIGERLTADPDRVGYDAIPFGALFGGDFVCLDFRASPTPSVAVWDHNRSDEFAPVFVPVAPSFAEFTTLLRRAS